MSPISPARFERLFRGLDSQDRTAFVAALWDSRGWETTAERSTVVATQDGETERIRVVDPGRFGTPTVADADVLVVARDREAVHASAEAAGVRYLAPEDIHERLLYGVERSTAAALFEQTFDQQLEPTTPPEPTPRERMWNVGTALASRADLGTLVVLLVIGSLVGAAAGPLLSSWRGASTPASSVESVTPDDGGTTETRPGTTAGGRDTDTGSEGRPPGLGERTLVDHVALAKAHTAAVGDSSRTVSLAASGPPGTAILGETVAWNTTVRIESPRRYRYDTESRFRTGNGTATREVSIYGAGKTVYRQLREGNETSYRQYPAEATGDPGGFADRVHEYLLRYLDGDTSTVECVATLAGDGDCFAYRVVVTGAPPFVDADAENYRAVAVVQDDGVVASLAVHYTLPVDGEQVAVRFQLEYDGVGETTVSPPDWLPTAKNETE